MGKGLAIVGILGAIAATLTILNVLQALASFLVLPVIVAGSIVLVAQRSVAGAVAGLLVLSLAVVTALGLAGSVTTESGTTDFGFSAEAGRVLAIAGCLSIPLAAIVVRWHHIDPQSLAYVGLFCAAVAFLLAIIRSDPLGDQANPVTLAIAALPLGAIASMVGLWRGADLAEPPTPAVP
ncbi:MAG: hypothetical protein WC876_04625 [Candidatus Thermoplasmatota archaeon]|jgi:hypothetical protein